MIERIRERLDVPTVLARRGVRLVRGRGVCLVCGGSNPTEFSVSSDGRRWHCFRCLSRGDVVDLVAELEGIPLREAIRRCARAVGIDAGESETAAERAERRHRQRKRDAEQGDVSHHRRALRAALMDLHRQLNEHRAKLRAAGPLGPPDVVEEGLLDASAYVERELRELPLETPKWALVDLWERWRIENAVARVLRGGRHAG